MTDSNATPTPAADKQVSREHYNEAVSRRDAALERERVAKADIAKTEAAIDAKCAELGISREDLEDYQAWQKRGAAEQARKQAAEAVKAEMAQARQARLLTAKRAALEAITRAAEEIGAHSAAQIGQFLQDRVRITIEDDETRVAYLAADGSPILDDNREPIIDPTSLVEAYLRRPEHANLVTAEAGAKWEQEEADRRAILEHKPRTLSEFAAIPKEHRESVLDAMTPEQVVALGKIGASDDARPGFLE